MPKKILLDDPEGFLTVERLKTNRVKKQFKRVRHVGEVVRHCLDCGCIVSRDNKSGYCVKCVGKHRVTYVSRSYLLKPSTLQIERRVEAAIQCP